MAKGEYADWEVYKRDDCRCRYCGYSGRDSFDRWRQLSIDHVMPKKHGGADTPENKVVCCKRCNDVLHDREPEGATVEEQIGYKRRFVAEKMAKERVDYLEMTDEMAPAKEQLRLLPKAKKGGGKQQGRRRTSPFIPKSARNTEGKPVEIAMKDGAKSIDEAIVAFAALGAGSYTITRADGNVLGVKISGDPEDLDADYFDSEGYTEQQVREYLRTISD